MARTRRMAALALFALMEVLLPGGFACLADVPVAVGARLSQDEKGAKLVFDLSRAVDASPSALASPDRIVIDMPEVNFQLDSAGSRMDTLPNVSIVKGFRFGLLAPGKSRIVIDLAHAACPVEVSTRAIVEGEPAARLTIVLKACDPSAFAALVRSSTISTAGASPAAAPSQPVIVLDPGHGGADSGARGLRGIQEKTVVFDFCTELKRQLDETERYATVMTRDGDQYVSLDDRLAIARRASASLFISVHADTLGEDTSVGGSTVYTLSDRASDAEAARIAARENAADAGLGRARPDNPDVADILFDLKRRETRTYAHIFSRRLVDNFRAAAKLNHNPERSAGFFVLKAPEFPSVLVELGYLSNAQDAQSLASPEWRTKSATAVVKAIDAFFARPGNPDILPASEGGVASSVVQVPGPAAH